MISMSTFLRTYNPPIPVRFAGFESNTLRLQESGWDLSVERMQNRDSMRLALRHERAGLYAITRDVSTMCMMDMARGGDWWKMIEFEVIWCGSGGRFHIMPQMGALNFKPVSGIPEFDECEYKDVDFRDAIPFRTINADPASEIIVAPDSVPELLEMILKLQDPRQAEIRERRRREAFRDKTGERITEMRPVSDIRAQIITLAS